MWKEIHNTHKKIIPDILLFDMQNLQILCFYENV